MEEEEGEKRGAKICLTKLLRMNSIYVVEEGEGEKRGAKICLTKLSRTNGIYVVEEGERENRGERKNRGKSIPILIESDNRMIHTDSFSPEFVKILTSNYTITELEIRGKCCFMYFNFWECFLFFVLKKILRINSLINSELKEKAMLVFLGGKMAQK